MRDTGTVSYEHLLVTVEGEIATITLNRPEKRNALAMNVMLELTEAFRHVGGGDARGVILAANGPVFRRLENSGAIGRRAIHPQEVARIFQRVARQLNAGVCPAERPWPDVRVGAHSTRIGAAHDLAAAGIDLTSIMHSGGWNDPKMPRYYTRELAAKDSGMARMVRARRVDEPSKA